MRSEARPIKDEETRALDELLNRRRQWVENCAQEKLRSQTAVSKKVRKSRQEHIVWLEKRIAHIDDGLEQNLRASAAWRVKENLLRGIPGMGPVTTLTLLLKCPELGHLGRHQIAALVGIARNSASWRRHTDARQTSRYSRVSRGKEKISCDRLGASSSALTVKNA
ncbi:MAG: hypothetical protein LBO79_08085 [Zoogloeaceae bacterium]|jgi:transposase|nr:hypothetical protein [Zoogloeaceae bacterium]